MGDGRGSVCFPVLVLVCLVSSPMEGFGQETLLERWTLGYLAEGWNPRWGDVSPSDAAQPAPLFRARLGGEVLGLGSGLDRDQSGLMLEGRVPLGSRSGVRVTAATGAWTTHTGGRPLLETPRSQAYGLGGDVHFDVGRLGALYAEAVGGWDGGGGGQAHLRSSSSLHRLAVTGWLTHARDSRIALPADSIGALGAAHRVSGVEVGAGLQWEAGGVRLAPDARWRRELFEESETQADGFLTASPRGAHNWLRLGMTLGVGRWSVLYRYRERDVSLDSRVYRLDESAGMLPVATMEMFGWEAGVVWERTGRDWAMKVGADRLRGALSARVETWPFASVWEAFSAQAYRLNGEAAARSEWARLGATSSSGLATGFDWGLEVGRYETLVERDSWYVTSFGFGRTDRERTSTGVDDAWLLGADVSLGWRVGSGSVGVEVEAGAPIHAASSDGSEVSADGVAGYLAVCFDWRR